MYLRRKINQSKCAEFEATKARINENKEKIETTSLSGEEFLQSLINKLRGTGDEKANQSGIDKIIKSKYHTSAVVNLDIPGMKRKIHTFLRRKISYNR